jgi:hypothetical protein
MRTYSRVALAAMLLAGCNPETIGAGSPPRERVTVAGRGVTIAAPPGLCIDVASTQVDAAGAFVLIRDCPGREARPPRAAMTASVSSGGLTGEGDAAADTLADLQAFLETPDGLALVGRSGRSGGVRVLAQELSGDVLFVLVEDRGPQPIAGLDRTFWRAFLEVNDRMTVLSVLGFADTSPQQGLEELAALASAIRAANPAGPRRGAAQG